MQRVLRKSYNRKYLDYVCVDAVGDILKPQYVSEHFKVILERNGLKKIRFHDLRHSCASLMLANDISIVNIQNLHILFAAKTVKAACNCMNKNM